MNVSSVNSVKSLDKSQVNRSVNNNNSPSFTGIGDSLVKFWQFVDNGGRALQFTVEDMCGTNLPRSYKGAVAGYKYTHKINVPAFLQEAVREFLTGPVMCISPVVILNIATKMTGKTANTHVENIRNLSYLMGKQIEESKSYDPQAFIETVTKDMLKRSTGKDIDEETIKDMTSQILSYKDLTEVKGAGAADAKSQAKDILAELEQKFQRILKQNADDYSNVDFLSAKYTVSAQGDVVKEGATKFKNYINYATEFAKDYEKQAKTSGGVNLENFKTTWIGRRIFTVASMFFITGVLMSAIPKLYTKVSGNVNPNAVAIYDEAKKTKTDSKGDDK